MVRPAATAFGLCGALCIVSATTFARQGEIPAPINKAQAISNFVAQNPRAGIAHDGIGRIERVYGPAFATGATPHASAEAFRLAHAGMWGITPDDLAAFGPFEDGRHLQPIMYLPETDSYKFTGVYYTQVKNGIPVFRTGLRLLTRNQAGYPLVLASADLRDLGGYQPDGGIAAKPDVELAQLTAMRQFMAEPVFGEPQLTIFAGVDDLNVAPTLALAFVGEAGDPMQGTYDKILFVSDASTGDILYQETLVHRFDVSGNVSGMATEGWGADTCANESLMPLPYARVTIGSLTGYADINGNYTIPDDAIGQVTVEAMVRGQYFVVDNISSADTVLSQNVTPPTPANFIFNEANTNEHQRAEVNAYIHANKARDYILAYNPNYPTISTQTEFPINVNINQTCNAFYNGTSINFYVSGGNCTNTANSTVVHHEYGHHLVATGGSGQGAYGEGMSDTLAVLISDQPCLGQGFNAGCGACLRNAQNNCNYTTTGCSTCGSAIHTCGQLISGCVWNTRNELLATNPLTYRDIISNIAINAVLLHSGTSITPSITIDYLTLDDNDGDITNGTPHYVEINAGFGSHNMPAPPLAQISFSYPNGRPEFVSPGGTTTMRVVINNVAGSFQPGTARLNVDTGGGYSQLTMTQVSPNEFDAVFPAAACGTNVKYYVSAQAANGESFTSPSNAPTGFFVALSAEGLGDTTFDDNFESDLGWVVTDTPSGGGTFDGPWERATPNTVCNRSNPLADADGSGMCYVTDNSTAGQCNSDIDYGTTTLTSPAMTVPAGEAMLSYWRWFDNTHPANTAQNDPFVVEISWNNGATWQNLETVGPTGPGTDGGWVFAQFSLTDLPGYTVTNQFRIRFNASDLGTQSVVEAGVDGVTIQGILCEPTCAADIDNTGSVDVNDLLAVINSWGNCPGCPADIDGNNVVDVNDLLQVINNWGACN